jgi:hypothetical protein
MHAGRTIEPREVKELKGCIDRKTYTQTKTPPKKSGRNTSDEVGFEPTKQCTAVQI